jgi:phage replication-related protein YjqB (UPF0714/DUF867 family)
MTASTGARRVHGQATAAAFEASVRKAFSSQATLLGRGEHCSVDPDRLPLLSVVLGSQVRVRRNPDQVALYTISETREESSETTMRMALPGRQRLGVTEEFEATIETRVPHPTLSDEDAHDQSEFVERLDDDGYQRGLVVIAPHGGAIEAETDRQAERVGACLGGDHASVWRCKGFKAGGGAFERWHITSTDIHEASFPLLRTIASRGFTYAVAFHGFSEEDVLVGGAAPLALKQEVAAALCEALAGSGIEVRVAGASEEYDGDNPANIVNRLTAGGVNGVQIEQSLEARTRFGLAMAEAVAAVCRPKLY